VGGRAQKVSSNALPHHISAQHSRDSSDIILHLAGILTVSGGKGKILEFFGPGAATLGTTAMSTVCNMSAEIGSTSCIFPYSDAMGRYLAATDRSYIAAAAQENLNLLQPDDSSEKHYDEIFEIDLSTLEPHINGPFTPDLSHTLSSFARDVEESSWPKEISHAMIGSCTNASFEDLSKAATLFREARDAGLKPKMPVFITAGSEKIRATVEREGILTEFEAAGATILSNSCGPCVGQWNRKEVAKVDALALGSLRVFANISCPGNTKLCDLFVQPQLCRQTRRQSGNPLVCYFS
jgi:aconitate hydratase